MADERDPQILPFAARTGRGPGNAQELPEEDVAPGNAFAASRGLRGPTALKFFLRGGLTFAMPYAYHPIVWGQSPELVLLEYPGFFSVMLAGSLLETLEARLCDFRVTWIRESDGEPTASPAARVTRIARLRSYPSREFDAMPPTID